MLLGLLVKMFLKFLVFLVFISQFVNSEITSTDYLNHYLENKENTKLLKVDFVVIQNLNIDKTDLKEKWEDLDTFNFSEELIALKEGPTKLVSLPSKYTISNAFFNGNFGVHIVFPEFLHFLCSGHLYHFMIQFLPRNVVPYLLYPCHFIYTSQCQVIILLIYSVYLHTTHHSA